MTVLHPMNSMVEIKFSTTQRVVPEDASFIVAIWQGITFMRNVYFYIKCKIKPFILRNNVGTKAGGRVE